MVREKPNPIGRVVGWSLAIVVTLAAIVVRVWASLDSFWLDEIWSWNLAQEANADWEIITKLKHDNNHILNTWVLYRLGPDVHWFWYRLPALVAGCLAVVVAGFEGWRRCPIDALVSLLMVGGSFLLVQYASEARGYAYVTFFSILSFLLLQRFHDEPEWQTGVAFSITAVLGFLSQLTFLFGLLPMLAWSASKFTEPQLRPYAGRMRLLYWPVAAVVFLICLVHVFGMELGGGQFDTSSETAVRALSLLLGGPMVGTSSIVVAGITTLVLLVALAWLGRRDYKQALFFTTVIVLFPVFTVLVMERETFYVRYFLVPLVFALLLLARFAAGLLRSPHRLLQGAAVIGLVVVTLGNAYHISRFLESGRGNFAEALAWIGERSPADGATIGAEHDGRVGLSFDFYQERTPGADRLQYLRRDDWPVGGPDWYVDEGLEVKSIPHDEITFGDTVYRHDVTFPFYGLSGWQWHLYRRHEPTRTNGGLSPAPAAASPE